MHAVRAAVLAMGEFALLRRTESYGQIKGCFVRSQVHQRPANFVIYHVLAVCDEAGVPARWTGSLAVFLRYLRKHFLERLYFEHLPPGASPDDDEEDSSAAEEDAAVGDADMAAEEPDEEPADEAPAPAGEAPTGD